MENKHVGYVLITDHEEKEGRFLVQLRGVNGKILHSSVEAFNKSVTVLNNLQRTAEIFGGSLKKAKVFDGTDSGRFFARGIASKRYTPRG